MAKAQAKFIEKFDLPFPLLADEDKSVIQAFGVWGPKKFMGKEYKDKNNTNQVHTTLCKQLALYITMYSPLQMAADFPEHYEKHMDAFQFIKDVAVDWDESKILNASIGNYVTIVRKEKGKENWFFGSITDEFPREFDLTFYFLKEGVNYQMVVYADGKNAHWKENPTSYEISSRSVKKNDKVKIKLASGGGCAISLISK